MNKAIQYREDGKIYGLVNVPKERWMVLMEPYAPNVESEAYKACIAAGKEIINPDVVVKHEYTPEGIHHTYKGKVVKPGEIFDCPDNIEFKEKEVDTVEDGGGCFVAGSKTVIRLKLKVKEELQDELWEEVREIFQIETYATASIEELKSKFTIQRNKNENET